MKTIETAPQVADHVMLEVRRHKLEISEEFGCDVVALGRSLQLRQKSDPRFMANDSKQKSAGEIAKPSN